MTKPAIIIPRVSSKGQDEENQVPDLQAFAASGGYEIIHTELVHGVSAFHGRHLKQVHAAVERYTGLAQAVIFWKLDRSTRQGLEGAVELRKRIRQAGMVMLFATQPYLNGDDAASEMMFANLAIMAKEESQTKSDRVKIKHTALRDAGSYIGKPFMGLDIVTVFDRQGKAFKTLMPGVQAFIVIRIFGEAAAASASAIARGLNADGLLTRQGARFREKSVLDTIRSPVYRGVVSQNGMTYMTVMPLVSASTWKAANDALKARAEGRGHGGGRPMISLLTPDCFCGANMTVYGRGKPWAGYRCAGLPGAKGCGNTIRQETLDAEVCAEFEAAEDVYIEMTVIPGADYSDEVAAVTLAIRDLDVNADDYLDRHAVLITELKRLKALPAEPARVTSEPVFDEYGGMMTEGDYFKSLGFKEQQRFIQDWQLTVWPKDHEPRWTLSLITPEVPERARINRDLTP